MKSFDSFMIESHSITQRESASSSFPLTPLPTNFLLDPPLGFVLWKAGFRRRQASTPKKRQFVRHDTTLSGFEPLN